MLSLIRAYQKCDPAANNKFEILLLYPGVKAIAFHRIAHFLYRYKIPFFPRLFAEFSRWITGIEIHPGAIIGKDCVIDHGMGTVIGETAVVGNQVIIYHGVTLGGTLLTKGKRHPTIEDGVMIGAGSKILGNITIGKNAKIGVNSIVIKNVPANTLIASALSKVIEKNSSSYNEWGIEYHI